MILPSEPSRPVWGCSAADSLPSSAPNHSPAPEDHLPTSSAVALQGWIPREPGAWVWLDDDRTGVTPGSGSVLVVDDDRVVRRLTARMLRGVGYTALEAASGMEALHTLERDPSIRLLVTDIIMPEMHGLDLVDRALARFPHLRIVLMTGHADEVTGWLEIRDPRLPMLLKPFTAEQLVTKVRDALADVRH